MSMSTIENATERQNLVVSLRMMFASRMRRGLLNMPCFQRLQMTGDKYQFTKKESG